MRNQFKQLTAITLIVATIITTLFTSSTTIQASELVLNETTGYSYTGVSPHLGYAYTHDPLYIMKLDGKKVFCVESGIFTNSGGGYVPEAYVNSKKDLLSKIAYHGFTNTKQSKYDYAVTQVMIWGELGDKYVSSDIPNYHERKAEIMELVNKHSTLPSFNNQSFTVQVGKSLTLNDTNKVISSMDLSSNTTNTSIELSGNTLKLTPSSTSKDGSITFQKIASHDIGTSIIYKKPNAQSLVEFHLENNVTSKININIIHLGNLQIKKVDEFTKLALPNAKLKFEYSGTSKEIITDTNGLAKISDIPEGTTVKVSEVTAPNGYFNKGDIKTFTIEPNKTIEFELNNKPQQGILNLQKLGKKAVNVTTNETNYGLQYNFVFDYKPLAGVTYEIKAMEDIQSGGKTYYNQGDIIAKVSTGDDGNLINMPKLFLGKYQAIEISAPSGFIINPEPIDFEFTYQDQFVEFLTHSTTINNEFQKVKLSLLKQEEFIKRWKGNVPIIDTQEANNKVFGLYTNQEIVVSDDITIPKDALITYGSVEKGILLLDNLQYPDASYYFKELDSGTHHNLNEKKYEFDFTTNNNDIVKEITIGEPDENGQPLPILNKLHFNEFSLKKQNERARVALNKGYIFTFDEIAKGAIFTLEDPKGNIIQTVSTNEESIASFHYIPVGTFYLKEKKTSSSNHVLSSKIVRIESTKEGVKAFDELDQVMGEQPAKIQDDAVLFEFHNELIKGSMTLKKIDHDTKIALPNAKIELLDKDKKSVLSLTTDENGIAHFEQLPKGIYYYKEGTAPTGYQLDTSYHKFEIKEHNHHIQLEMSNKKIPSELPQTGDSSGKTVLILSLTLLISGASLIYLKMRRDQ